MAIRKGESRSQFYSNTHRLNNRKGVFVSGTIPSSSSTSQSALANSSNSNLRNHSQRSEREEESSLSGRRKSFQHQALNDFSLTFSQNGIANNNNNMAMERGRIGSFSGGGRRESSQSPPSTIGNNNNNISRRNSAIISNNNNFESNLCGLIKEEEELMSYRSQNQNQNSFTSSGRRKDNNSGKEEFIPSFVLVDACKSNNERKVKEWIKKLAILPIPDLLAVVNFQDNCGRTALSYACSSGGVGIVDELTKIRKIDPNIPDTEGCYPLHYASQAGHSEVVDLLLTRFEKVIDLNCRNEQGLTPLMKSALQGRTRCVKSLIINGANVHCRDYSRNLTASEWARLCGRHICAEVIHRCAKDNFQFPPESSSNSTRQNKMNQSNLDLRSSHNAEESSFSHMFATSSSSSNRLSGTSWIKKKIKKVLLGTTSSSSASKDGRRDPIIDTVIPNNCVEDEYGMLRNLSGPTICASSLLPSIKPLIEEQRRVHQQHKKTIPIPIVHITPVISNSHNTHNLNSKR